jgi:hypothetical protein
MDAQASLLDPRPRHFLWLWVIALTILALSISLGVEIWLEYQHTRDLIARGEQLAAVRARSAAAAPSRTESDEQKRWAVLKNERDFAWGPLFRAIERSVSKDVELLEFLPEKSSRRVVLRGETRNDKALIDFLSALAAQPTLEHVHLVHQQGTAREGMQTVSFEIRANYIAGAPATRPNS